MRVSLARGGTRRCSTSVVLWLGLACSRQNAETCAEAEECAGLGASDPAALVSMSFARDGPPRSGTMQSFPEVEEARWFTLPAATEMMLPSQLPLLGRLAETLGPQDW